MPSGCECVIDADSAAPLRIRLAGSSHPAIGKHKVDNHHDACACPDSLKHALEVHPHSIRCDAQFGGNCLGCIPPAQELADLELAIAEVESMFEPGPAFGREEYSAPRFTLPCV